MDSAESIILTYHSIDTSASVLSVAPNRFAEQMRMLAASRIPVVPLSQSQAQPGSVALTFDDAYVNVLDAALPVLVEFGFPATVFMVSGMCGKMPAWKGAANVPLMSWPQLSQVQAHSIEIGAHSRSHPDLTRLPETEMLEEVETCQQEIGDRLGHVPSSFAYPYGSTNARVRQIVSLRYGLACGTRLRMVDPESDGFDLPRLDVYYFRETRRFSDLLEGRAGPYLKLRRLLRQVPRWVG